MHTYNSTFAPVLPLLDEEFDVVAAPMDQPSGEVPHHIPHNEREWEDQLDNGEELTPPARN